MLARILNILFLNVIVVAVTSFANAQPADIAVPSEAWLAQLAETERERHQQPALAVAIVRSGHSPMAAVVGQRQDGAVSPVQREDRFHFGSCTKAMTATIVGLLVQEGLLNWDDRALHFFPELAETVHTSYAPITVRDLLSHRAGVVAATAGLSPESRALNQLTGTPREQREAAVGVVLGFEPVAEPQTQTMYSNAGYSIAAAIVERVTDTPWEQLMAERVFMPLAMSKAGLGWPATAERPDEPMGHLARGDQLTALPLDSPYAMHPAIAPASDAHGSIEDLARFAAMHLDALRGRDALLSQRTAQMLHAKAVEDDLSGLGWVRLRIADTDVSWHNGSVGTFFAWMTVCPQLDLAVVVATNAGNGEAACRAVTEVVLRAAQQTAEKERN